MARLGRDVAERLVKELDGWTLEGDAIKKQFVCRDFPDAIQIGVISPDQLDQDRLFGFEVVIQASRENSCGVGNLLEGRAQTRGSDQRGRRLQDLGSPSPIGGPGLGRQFICAA